VWGVNLIHKTVSAEGTGTVTVDAILDFSNVWVSKKSLKDIYDAKGKLIFNSATRDCYGCGNENWIYTPGDWFELKVTSAEIKTNSYGTKSFQIEYDGVYHHFHGYDHFTGDCYCKSWTTNLLECQYHDINCTKVNSCRELMSQFTEELIFNFKGKSVYEIPSYASYYYFPVLFDKGVLKGTHRYAHDEEVDLDWYQNPKIVSSNEIELFPRWTDFGNGTDGFIHTAKNECWYMEYDFDDYYYEDSRLYPSGDLSLNRDGIHFFGVISPGDAKGTIEGEVVSGVGQVTITRATVSLYRQNGFLREQQSGETDDEYKAYVKSMNTLVQQTRVSDKGKFTFYDVPVLQSFDITGSKNWRTSYYTIEVTGAEADVDEKTFGMPVFYFSSKAKYNVRADTSDNTIQPGVFAEIGMKKELVNDLSNLSENHYKAVEQSIEVYLDDLESGKKEKTDVVLEALRRGIWAEKVVREGANDANDLLKAMLEGIANLLADLYKDRLNFDSDALTRAKKLKKETEEKMKRVPASVRKSFGITDKDASDYLNKTLGDSARLLTDAEAASVLEKIIKVARVSLLNALHLQGMPKTKADDIAVIAEKALSTLMYTIQHNSLAGGLKMGVPELVKYAVPKVRPLLFDNSSSLCYTSYTKDTLKYSVDKMQAWSRADTSAYQTDSANAAQDLNELIQKWTDIQWRLGYYKAIADTAETAGAVMGVAGKVIKQAAVAEKLLKISKYVSNGATLVDPAVFVYLTGSDLMEKGAYASYGEKPPTSGSATAAMESAMAPCTVTVEAAPKGGRLHKAAASTGSQLKDALGSVAKNLQDNEIGQAMEASGGNGAGNYKDAIAVWKQSVSLFLTQALGGGADVGTGTAGVALKNLMNEDIESKKLETDMGERLMDIYTDILSGEYKNTSDSLYVAERNKCISVINSLISKVDELSEEMDSFTNSTKDVEFLPAVVTKATLSSSDEGNEGVIAKSPQEFTLRVQVRNISTVSVSGLSAELTVTSPKNSVKVLSGAKLTVGNGTLAADDGVDGSGNDEAYVEWTIKYEGDLSQESILLEVDILENDETPSGFVTANAQEILLTDPSLYDKDIDYMPDEWETSNGLDTKKDDSGEDPDGDGLTNGRESELDTKPNVADTDGDGLSDGDEVNGTGTGFDTDPLKADTDDDGASDGSDGQPLDDGTILKVKVPKGARTGHITVTVDGKTAESKEEFTVIGYK